MTYDDDKFLVSLDCKHFKPEELDVKVDGTTIVIVAKQEVKESGGTRTRVFEQKFTLPNGVQADRVTSTINADGVLTINAPKGKPASSAVSQSIEQKMDKILSPASWPDHSLGSSMDDFDNSNSRVRFSRGSKNLPIFDEYFFRPTWMVTCTKLTSMFNNSNLRN